MKNLFIGFVLLFSLSSFSNLEVEDFSEHSVKISSIYESLVGAKKPDFELFEKAYLGYIDLKLSGFLSLDKEILSIVDFRVASNKERLWVIDLKSKTILHHTLVAHGEGSGKEYALDFSNEINSHKSSLGFYITEDTYVGKNGLSLRLRGIERGFNTNALERYVVIHGADYATKSYLKENGMLGNSKGCPAVPMGEHLNIIEITKEGTCLFIYFPDDAYLRQSNFIMDVF
ncbi:MAG: murein L,D-transpeptidase catalytic domain family protein [Vicingaceae bacterium]